MATYLEVLLVMERLARTWPEYNLTEQTNEIYADALSDIPADALMAGAKKCIRTCTFFPKPAEIIKACVGIVFDDVQSAAQAWGDVKRNVSADYGFHFDNPYTERAIHALGGLNIRNGGEGSYGQSPPDDEPSWRARFMAEYDRLVAQARDRASESDLELEMRRQLRRPLEPGARLSDGAPDTKKIIDDVTKRLTGGKRP
jgi:hypothetical protein